MAAAKDPMDVARLATDVYEDAHRAMAESYAMVVTMLIAVLQRTGPITVPHDFDVRAQGLVTYAEPLPSGAWRVSAIPREEGGTDLEADAAHVHERFTSQYARRESGSE